MYYSDTLFVWPGRDLLSFEGNVNKVLGLEVGLVAGLEENRADLKMDCRGNGAGVETSAARGENQMGIGEAEPSAKKLHADAERDMHSSASGHVSISVHQLVTREGTIRVRSEDAAPAAETHYVMLIHGTFSRPDFKGKPNWFWPDPDKGNKDNFANHLAELLGGGELGEESVWRTLLEPELLPSRLRYPFYWDGSNTDQGRKEGAWYLARLIRHVANKDPSARVHLVCHSHGGNVALKAIEQYIEKLESSSCEADCPETVRARFQEAHKPRADEIAHWRRVEDVSWWAALNPFLVVKRGRKGESGAEERYSWGYHRVTDAALGLGKRRKKRYLANRRMTSPVTNALGKVVFLGTPFYYKEWARYAIPKILLSLFLSFVGGFCLVWLGVGIRNFASKDELTSSQRRIVVYVAIGVAALLFLTNLASFAGKTLFRSGNMYHSNKVPWSPAQHALVIKAGKLDEAALALCAEPAARAFLLPMVKQATAHIGFVAFPPRPRHGARAAAWALYVVECLHAVLLNVILLLPRVLVWLASKLIVKSAFAMVRDVIVSISFGLDAADLKNANVYVEETLVLGGCPRDIRTWDVRKLLARAELGAASRAFSEGVAAAGSGECAARARAQFEGADEIRSVNGKHESIMKRGKSGGSGKSEAFDVEAGNSATSEGYPSLEREASVSVSESAYTFLWDDDELRARSDASVMFARLRAQMPRIDHSPRLTPREFAREVRSICCVFEARFHEVRNHLQLAHATYYQNPVIVGAMVRFLNTAEAPPEAQECKA
ncbi:hypothetical protein KFL_000700270 [Klebsormidium nitens]|uniref:Uncharacterized protein n=1 Tax=Klebsormidium nitens TaxID=105231 RepID=A0A1Y1HR37_KLENI|nr:hypothetical protein KFL_000700270 [Klebsormidium nitens]|eukprot:GAQ81090.1 hypothetical protein KFL_000700270 [Klebsormidium nitens]